MSNETMQEIEKAMPTHLRVKVNRVMKDRNLTFADAVLFLVRKGINASAKKRTGNA